jgi:3-hydroxybutyryl-CoA dehydrogenase
VIRGPIEDIGTVAYIGAGTMGCVNSLVAAVSGYDVVLHDASGEVLRSLRQRHDGVGASLVSSGYCTGDQLADGLKRVSSTSDLAEALSNADLVSESIPEDRDAKRSVHRQADELAPPKTMLTTNTSTLLVSDVDDVVARGDRFAALHSHRGSLLHDIVGGPRTSADTIDVLRRFVESLGGTPIVLKKEHTGYVFDSINGEVLSMAVRLVLDGHATVEQVDRAWMRDRGAPMGPFGMMDLVGLDTLLDRWSRQTNDVFRDELRRRIEPFLVDHVRRGRLGQKSGAGFYHYPRPAYQHPDFWGTHLPSRVASDALLVALIAAAVLIEINDVADRADVDMAWSAATSLRVGPFALLERQGVDGFLALLAEQRTRGLVAPDSTESVRVHLQLADQG